MTEGLCERLLAARYFRPQGFLPLALGEHTLGWIRRDQADRLRAWPDVFDVAEYRICLSQAPEPVLSNSIAKVTQALARDGAIRGWRGETYAVRADAGGAVLFHIERAAMRFFGFTSAAAQLNGYTGEGTRLRILTARRAATKAIDPGMLDILVAGGVPSGEEAWQTLLRECGEEAGIPAVLAQNARPAGVLQVRREVPDGLHSEILNIHDLAFPADFAPRNTDGEVSEFLELKPESLFERIARGEMTVEAGLVSADFALRHGLIQDEDGTIGAAIEACRLTPP